MSLLAPRIRARSYPFALAEIGGDLLAQKYSFLCAAKGVSSGSRCTKRFGAGLFGGEGFILQRLQGDGLAFLHAGGTIHERTLAPGEQLRVDTGCIVAFQPSVEYDIQFVGKVKTALFGGEGLFFARLRGPGRIWLQSLPFSRLAGRIYSASKGGKGEGSVLGRPRRVAGWGQLLISAGGETNPSWCLAWDLRRVRVSAATSFECRASSCFILRKWRGQMPWEIISSPRVAGRHHAQSGTLKGNSSSDAALNPPPVPWFGFALKA